MLQELDLRQLADEQIDSKVLPRPRLDIRAAVAAVEPLMADVKERGYAAVQESSAKFDGVTPASVRVPQAVIDRAADSLDPGITAALHTAIKHNRLGHEAQKPEPKTTTIVPGGVVEQRWIPVHRVGLYVPGGLAVYPSSVVMNVVAAQVAGVESIALASPANRDNDGWPHPTILAACKLLGVDEVYAAGGASAVALFAYGAAGSGDEPGCAPVDVITGPGNIYVAAAKRIASSSCGIDAEAGTTEIAIIADEGANVDYVCYDLISQAEHDPAAASVLISHSEEFISAVQARLGELAASQKHHERIVTALSGPQSGAILTRDLDQSIRVANAYAAEHLEIQTRNPGQVAHQIRNAGAIFVGDYTPVPVGDYIAGSNHVLPTGGTARYRAGLNVMAFIKPVQVITYGKEALAGLAQQLTVLAEAEDLPAHAAAVNARGRE